VPAPVVQEIDPLKQPTGNQMLDELNHVYKLRQDMERSEDLESEERALANLTA